ncbi:hypothetical protein [Dyadobacter sp. NIV53]|uniref:hypothetical protein n=1 Tax=Dyadobacter sp. NIV53 TaxID=2861765 RepID=UPI001C86FE09|nr:hypothetical protein [Dyadobacter sp. NIV53]
MDGKVKYANGRSIKGLKIDISKKKTLSEILAVLAKIYGEQSHTKEDELVGELLIFRNNITDFQLGSFQLVYKIPLKRPKEINLLHVYADAETGEVLKEISLFQNCIVDDKSSQTSKSINLLPPLPAPLCL